MRPRSISAVALALVTSSVAVPIREAAAGSVCGPCYDFMTGGGWFEPPNKFSSTPFRVNYGFNAGSRNGTAEGVKGNVNVVDHARPNIHVQGDVTAYEIVIDPSNPNCRRFSGPARFNGAQGYLYRAGACDNNEPGRNDRFFIVVFGANDPTETPVYFADNLGELDGGNNQLHKPCPQ